MKRVAELEKALESESAKFKRKLDEAEQREIELMQAEKVEVSRLLSLLLLMLEVSDFLLLFLLASFMFPSCDLNLCVPLCRKLRRCSSTRKHL